MAGYFNLNNNEISKELLVKKFNTMLDNPNRLTPVATQASLVASYSKVMQRPRLGDIGCLSWSPLQKYERQPNNKVLQIQLDTF